MNIALVVAVAAAYLAIARRQVRKAGGLSALLERREPAILLDSARVAIALLWLPLTPDLAEVSRLLEGGVLVDSRTLLGRMFDLSKVPIEYVTFAVYSYRVSMVLLALGWFARVAALFSAAAYTFAWSVTYAFTHAGHNHVVVMVLLVFALHPERSIPVWSYASALRRKLPLESVGTAPAYVRFAAMAPIVTAYFQGGVEKLIRSGLYWVNGITLEGHLRRVGAGPGLELAALDRSVLVALSAAIMAWELAFGLVLLFPRLRLLGALSAYVFHTAMSFFLGPPFVALRSGLLLLFPPYELVRGRKTDETRLGASTGRASRIHGALLVGLILLQWVPTAIRDDRLYPFFNYAMFNGFYREGERLVAGSRIWAVRDGKRSPFPSARIHVGASVLTEQLYIRGVSDHPRHRQYRSTVGQYCRSLLMRVREVDPTIEGIVLEVDLLMIGSSDVRADEVARCDQQTTDREPS